MSMIPDEKVQEIRERASILEVIADYVNLRKSGANYQGLCPFHGEKTPSFNVNPARGIFHCFGCGVGGNVFSFIMRAEGLTFPEAVRFLGKRVGVEIEDRPLSGAEMRRRDEREELFRIQELAVGFYRRVLQEEPVGEAGRRYLEARGVSAETAEVYRLGFAPDRWDSLTRFLERKKVPLELAEKLGLLRRRDSGGHYDTFRNRLLFTIADPHGRPIGFGGRVLDDSLPKYINSPESPIYSKGEVLFGVDLAKAAMREQGTAIIVEGYFDHLMLHQAGVKNAVATCGTALTNGHLGLLRRYAGKVYTLFDSDSAGKKATIRSMELFLAAGMPAAVVELPSGDDPDSFVGREGGEAFAARVAHAVPIFDYYVRDLLAGRETGSVEGKRGALAEILPRLRLIDDRLQRQLYATEIARLLGVRENDIRREVGLEVQRTQTQSRPAATRKSSGSAEELLLALMARYPEVARRVGEFGAVRLFSPSLLPVAEAILERLAGGTPVDVAAILDGVALPEERCRLAALFVDDRPLDEIDAGKAFEQCRQALERASLKEQDVKSLQRELARLDSNSERYWEILKTLDSLRNRKSQLL